MTNKKLTNMAKGTDTNDAVIKQQLDTKLSLSGGLMTGTLDMNSNRIYNVAQPDGDNQPATKIWSENKFLDKSSGVMAGPLNMSNNKITHLANPTADKDAVSRVFGDGRYVLKGGDTMTGDLALGDNYIQSRQTANHLSCKKIYISTCHNCSSVGCPKCVQFHNWFRLH